MRTIDTTLTAALAAGTGRPVLTGYIGYGGGFVIHSADVTAYMLTGTTLEIEVPYSGDIVGDQTHVWLERGLTIAGVNYTLTTGRFVIQSQHYQANGSQVIKGTLFPKQYYSANGHGTYKTVIDAFCTAFNKTAVYRDPAAAWLTNTFLPLGKSIILNDANAFANLLRQKYLVFMADNGNEEVLFYSCEAGLAGAADITYTAAADFFIEKSKNSSRKYIWRDEIETVHTDGTATDPLHNLGFLWSTNLPPAIHSAPSLWQMSMRPDLRVLDGDIIAVAAFGSTLKAFALVTEEYIAPDKGHSHPRWMTTITANEIFGNTAGGAMPSTIERVSNYTPLNTSMFGGALSANDNNLQAAMDTLDDHSHRIPITSNLLNQTVPAATSYWWCPGTSYFGATGYGGSFPSGKVKNLRVKINSTQPATGSLVFTLYIASAATTITFTVPAGQPAVPTLYSDTTHEATVAAGDTITLNIQNNAPAAASAQIGALSFEFLPNP